MVPAHLPETMSAHAQSDMEVICKRGVGLEEERWPIFRTGAEGERAEER